MGVPANHFPPPSYWDITPLSPFWKVQVRSSILQFQLLSLMDRVVGIRIGHFHFLTYPHDVSLDMHVYSKQFDLLSQRRPLSYFYRAMGGGGVETGDGMRL